MSQIHQEHIIAIDANLVPEGDANLRLIPMEIKSSDIVIEQRAKLEENTQRRQIIPYMLIRCNDMIGVYRRTKKGHENRLHGKISVGVGGHVDATDVVFDADSCLDLKATLVDSSARELAQELALLDGNTVLNGQFLGCALVSSETPVDAVHIGIVMVMDVATVAVESNEPHLEWLGFMTPAEVLELPNLENWTRGLCQNLVEHPEFLSGR